MILHNINRLCHLKIKITRCFQHTSYVFLGSRFSSKPSPDFHNLLEGLLQKDPDKRLSYFFYEEHCTVVSNDLQLFLTTQ